MAKPDKKTLFLAYQEQDDKVETLRKQLDEAIKVRSGAVHEIVKNYGNGPFQWRGEVIKATKRDSKDENEKVIGTTYFFKSMGTEVEKIEE